MSQNSIDQIITSRMSARAFTQQAVAKELIEQILYVASRAPSGTNTQPWKAYVLQGNSRDQLVEKVCKAHNEIRQDPSLAKNYQEEGYIEVYDNNGPLDSINELEYVNGKIYANVYLTNKIVVINPQNGEVEAEIDLTELVPKNFFKTSTEVDNNVLNGIAWDANGKRLFVTGKKWPKLYQIEIAQ